MSLSSAVLPTSTVIPSGETNRRATDRPCHIPISGSGGGGALRVTASASGQRAGVRRVRGQAVAAEAQDRGDHGDEEEEGDEDPGEEPPRAGKAAMFHDPAHPSSRSVAPCEIRLEVSRCTRSSSQSGCSAAKWLAIILRTDTNMS